LKGLRLVFEEFGKGSGEWWIFTLDGSHAEWDYRWIIVDYGGKRMWGDMCRQTLCFWDDIWEPRTWKIGKKDLFKGLWIDDDSDDGDSDGLSDEWKFECALRHLGEDSEEEW
jgi:hypothetical protein